MVSVLLPLHVTGYWFSVEGVDPLHTGSLGAGINLSPLEIRLYRGEPGIYFEDIGPVRYKTLLDSFSYAGVDPVPVKVSSRNVLGVGYGLSGGLALASLLLAGVEGTYEEIGRYVHRAEVENRTGYGDVIAVLRGGLEVRVSPGAPGIGRVEKIPVKQDIDILSLEYGGLSTPEMIRLYGERVARVGPEIHRLFLRDPSLERFIELSHRFSLETGLLDKGFEEEILSILRSAGYIGYLVGMHRKKNVLLIYLEKGVADEVRDLLSSFGRVETFKIWEPGLVLRND